MKTLFQIQQKRTWVLVYAMVSLFISLFIFSYLFLEFGKEMFFTEKYWVAGLYTLSILLFSHAIEWFIRGYYWFIKIQFHFWASLFWFGLVFLWIRMDINYHLEFLIIFPLFIAIMNLIGCKPSKTPQDFDFDLAKKYLEENYPCSPFNEVFELCHKENSWHFVWKPNEYMHGLYFTKISVAGEDKSVYKCKRKYKKMLLPARFQNSE